MPITYLTWIKKMFEGRRHTFWLFSQLFLLIFCTSVSTINAQDTTKYQGDYLDNASTLRTTLLKFPLMEFPNINKISNFTGKKVLGEVREVERTANGEDQFFAFQKYVSAFGIKDFQQNSFYLWRLANLAEEYSTIEKAKFYYQLALKHGPEKEAIKNAKRFLRNHLVESTEDYVSLDRYYEIVDFRLQVDTLQPPRGVLLNMGADVNSQFDDYGPNIYEGNNLLIFTSKRNQISMGLDTLKNEDLFFSRKDSDGIWSEAKAFKNVNTRFNEGSACLSKDGRTIVFARCGTDEGYGNCDLYIAELDESGEWTNVENLGPEVNSPSWDSHPTLSHTGDTLYFSSDRVEGFGLADIYYTYKDRRGRWKPAQNVGPIINTRNSEVSPFYHPKFNVLYFSSNGHLLNFGEFDIYKTYQKDQEFSESVNIGPLVNGKGSEFYFSIDPDSKDIFYSKSEKADMENLDLFSFPLPMGGQPEATSTFRGSLTDMDGNPQNGIVSIIDMTDGIEVAPKFLRADGTFEFNLINDKRYLLIIQGDNYFRIEELFKMEDGFEINKEAEPLSSRIKFESIEFDNASADILPSMYEDLQKIMEFMGDNPNFKLKISGHTDTRGNSDINKRLSQDRADRIKEFISHFGSIEADRIESVGYGSSQPIVVEKNDADRKLNRRVEFEITRLADGEWTKTEVDDDGWR